MAKFKLESLRTIIFKESISMLQVLKLMTIFSAPIIQLLKIQ